MIKLLGALHPLGGKDAAKNILPEELCDEGARDAIISPLFLFRVDLIILRTHTVELLEGILIDVVVHLATYQFLEEIISLKAYATFRPHIISLQQGLHHALRLLLLLDVGEDQADDVWDHIAVLHLFGLLPLLVGAAQGSVFLILNFFEIGIIFKIGSPGIAVRAGMGLCRQRTQDDGFDDRLFAFRYAF